MSAPLRCPQCSAAVLHTASGAPSMRHCRCSRTTCGWRDTLPTAMVALSALLAAGLADPEPAETEPACLADT